MPAESALLSSSAFAHHQDGDLAGPRTVLLGQEYPLPPSERECAVDDVETGRRSQQQRSAVRVAVSTLVRSQVDRSELFVVVPVCPLSRGRALERGLEIVEQQRLVLVDDDRRGGVQAVHVG